MAFARYKINRNKMKSLKLSTSFGIFAEKNRNVLFFKIYHLNQQPRKILQGFLIFQNCSSKLPCERGLVLLTEGWDGMDGMDGMDGRSTFCFWPISRKLLHNFF